MLERLFAALREQEAVGEDADCFGIDSTSFQVHPDGTGARRKKGPQSVGRSRGGRDAKIHMVSAARSHGIAPVPIGHTAYMWMYDRDDDGCVCE